jgi:hypothetical protein
MLGEDHVEGCIHGRQPHTYALVVNKFVIGRIKPPGDSLMSFQAGVQGSSFDLAGASRVGRRELMRAGLVLLKACRSQC